MAFKVNINGNVQYVSREAGIKAHAEDYSFNIESELFYQLSPEQQNLWRKEIEQAVLSGGYCGLELAKDKRYDEEPVSEDLKEVANAESLKWADGHSFPYRPWLRQCFINGAKWQKENLWKSADGDNLPDIDREVIALLDNGKVVYAHRPPEYWDGKDIVTGKVTRNYPKTYDKGGWNIPNIKYWLDVKLPKEIEL